MNGWRRIDQTWCYWPNQPIGLIEIIGGSYLATTPSISYKRLIESLAKRNLAVHAWSYIPGFDHQSQANKAWKEFRFTREKLKKRCGNLPKSVRVGHSLGCKLHLLSPDKGRNSQSLIALSFNNFNANRSIPMLKNISSKFNLKKDFRPNSKETMMIISQQYINPKNLLIKFENDILDQSESLLHCLQSRRDIDQSTLLTLKGDHLTPASAGLRNRILGELSPDQHRYSNLQSLIEIIYEWSIKVPT